jgi:hypothetical protein
MHALRLLIPAVWLMAATALPAAPAPIVGESARIVLPDVRGRIDHLAIDRAGRRLFIAALGHNTIEVVDLAAGKAMRSISGFSEPQGIAYAPDLNRLYVANGGDGTVRVLNAAYFGELASIPLGDDADNVRYDATRHQLAVGFGQGNLALIDATTHRLLGKIELTSHPEAFQLEPDADRIFVNVPGSRAIVIVNRATQAVSATWALRSAGGNFPLAFDATGRRLFIGCRTPALLLTLDGTDGHELGRNPLHEDCDDLFYDASRQRVYASCGEGFIDVFDVPAARPPARLESVPTARGARTCLLDGEHLYLAVPRRGSTAAEIRVFEVKE